MVVVVMVEGVVVICWAPVVSRGSRLVKVVVATASVAVIFSSAAARAARKTTINLS